MIVALGGSNSLLLPPAPHERLEALADSRLTLLTEGAQRALLEVPAAAAVILERLATRLRDCQASLSQFSNPRHVDRVREKLTQLAGTYGKVGTEGVWLSLPLTHEALARMVGSTRETVTRAVSQLIREEFVRHERGAYRLALRRKRPDP
jgi:CRP/FNR family transcriptional regulator